MHFDRVTSRLILVLCILKKQQHGVWKHDVARWRTIINWQHSPGTGCETEERMTAFFQWISSASSSLLKVEARLHILSLRPNLRPNLCVFTCIILIFVFHCTHVRMSLCIKLLLTYLVSLSEAQLTALNKLTAARPNGAPRDTCGL